MYAAAGHRVAISARRGEKLEQIAAELGGAVLPVPVDVTDRDAMVAAAAGISEELGEIDIAIMNAAFWQQVLVESWDSALVRRHFDTNVMGLVHGIEAVLPSMRRRRSGTIVGMASLAGYRGFPRSEGYGPTKAAMINMLEALRIDLQPLGISVITVCPGFVRTDLTSHNRFPMPFLLEADDAARRIVRGHRPRQGCWSRFRCRWRSASRPCSWCPRGPTPGRPAGSTSDSRIPLTPSLP